MRVAISNIAWDPAEDEDVARLLQRHHVDAIDVAPGNGHRVWINLPEGLQGAMLARFV